jgi:transposase
MDKEEYNRVIEFRQIKQEIRGSKDYLIVGIDVAKEKNHAFFGTARGKALFKGLIFENSREGFERLLFQTEAVKTQHNLKKVLFGLEPTANYHKPLGEYLIKNNHWVVLVSGNAVKNNRELLDGRWDKHDVKDAANVTDLISQGKIMFYDYPCLALREVRSLLSLKRKLKKQEQGYKIRIRNHLVAQYFPEFDRYWGYGEGWSIVRGCLDPSEIAGMRCEQFIRLAASANGGITQRRRLQTIWEKANISIGCAGTEAMGFEAQVMVDGLKQVREVIRLTDAKIKDRCNWFSEYNCLLSIPGFGPDISAKTLAAIGNPFRFENTTQVLKLAGLDLSAQRSGKRSDAVTPVLSKKGKADLRYALYQAALIASTRNRTFIAYFTNKLKGREREKGIKTKMRVKLSAKLLVIAWTIMKKKEPFNPEYLTLN